jgi:hypothetical protein
MGRDITMQVIAHERARRALDDAGDAFDRLAGRSEASGKRMSASASALGGHLKEVRGELEVLQRRYGETGDARYLREISAKTRQVSQVTQILKEQLRDLGDDKPGGGLTEKLSFSIGSLPPIPPQVAAAVAAPLLPAIGAAASAGILAGVGGGALAIGVAAAAQSAEVKAAWTGLAADAGTEFARAGHQFRDPVVASIGEIRTAIKGLDLAGALEPTVALIDPLTRGIVGLANNAMPGLRSAAKAAVEPIQALAEELPDVGSSLSTALEGVSHGADGAARALRDLLNVSEASLASAGEILGGLAEVYKLADEYYLTSFLGHLDEIEGRHGTLVKLGDDGSDSMKKLAGAADDASSAVDRLRDEIDSLNSPALDWAHAEIEAQNAIRDLKGALDESSGSLDVHTAKGAAARDAALQLAEAAAAAVSAKYAETGSVVAASDVYIAYRGQLISTLTVAGVARAEAERLADAWLRVPPSVSTNYHVVTTYEQRGTPPRSGSYADIPTGRIGGIASGGPITGPGPEGVDSELRMLAPGEHVLTAAEVRAAGGHAAVVAWRRSLTAGGMSRDGSGSGGGFLSPAGGGYAGGSTTINVTVQAGLIASPSEVGSAVATALRQYVRDSGPMPELVGQTS